MDFFKKEIERYSRRVEKVKNNPDPNLFQCNRRLYEIWRDHFIHLNDVYESGGPFAYCQGTSLRPLTSMGVIPLQIAELADRVRGDIVLDLFHKARSLGFPEDSCDWAQTGFGLTISGYLPKAAFAYTEATECNIYVQQMFTTACFCDIPLYTIDGPKDLGINAIEYVAEQFQEMISNIEKSVPGTRYDEIKHIDLLTNDKAVQDVIDEINILVKTRPMPLSTGDMFRMAPFGIFDYRLPEYYREFRDELKEKINSGYSAYPDEKCRVMWLGELFNYADPFAVLEEGGVIVPVYEEGPGISSGRRIMEFDDVYGRKLTPLEEEARAAISPHWGGPVEWRLKDALRNARQFDVDGVVHMIQPGCSTCAGSAQVIAEEMEKELNIPTLIIEGNIQDFKKYNKNEIENKLENFRDMLLHQKGFI